MKKLSAALIIAVGSIATFTGCENLAGTIGPIVQDFRTFTYSYKRLPEGVSLAHAKILMERNDGSLEHNARTYIGNKENNTLFYRLRAVPPASSHSGELMINVRDQDVTVPEATGALIDVLPLPQVGDTVTSADVHIYITDGLPTEYVNANDPNSYFRLVLKSLDYTNNKASGWFEALVTIDSGPNAGAIYAITDGEFIMDISN